MNTIIYRLLYDIFLYSAKLNEIQESILNTHRKWKNCDTFHEEKSKMVGLPHSCEKKKYLSMIME